eukprot:402164-Prymnesium_polylepis.3
MDGYQACVMCYGQTGAGKSYTLANNKVGSEGIMVQAFNYIFERASSERELKYEIHLSFVQVRFPRSRAAQHRTARREGKGSALAVVGAWLWLGCGLAVAWLWLG